jgi:hypothetical protein
MGRARGGAYEEVELTEAVRLCDPRGHLLPASVGWSRHPLHICNLRGHWPRKKKWNYWCVTNDNCLFSVTLANIDYVGLAFAYFLEYETKRFIEQTVMVPLGRGCSLPDTVSGDISFENKAMNLSFTEDQGCTRIHVDSPAFGGTTLSAELRVEHPKDHETLNVVIPWSKSRFNFTSKQNCLPTTGTVSALLHFMELGIVLGKAGRSNDWPEPRRHLDGRNRPDRERHLRRWPAQQGRRGCSFHL